MLVTFLQIAYWYHHIVPLHELCLYVNGSGRLIKFCTNDHLFSMSSPVEPIASLLSTWCIILPYFSTIIATVQGPIHLFFDTSMNTT